MDVTRYMIIRTRQVELYNLLMNATFPTHIPRSHLMSLKTLQRLVDNPPIHGTDWMDRREERPMTIVGMCVAYSNMGSEAEICFTRPEIHVPRVFEIIQEYVGNWVELMMNYSWFQHPPLEELDLLEGVAKHLFPVYKEYKLRTITQVAGTSSLEDMSLTDLFRVQMQLGGVSRDGISFISNMGIYRDSINDHSMPGGFDTIGNVSNGLSSTSNSGGDEDPFEAFKRMQTGIGGL